MTAQLMTAGGRVPKFKIQSIIYSIRQNGP